MEITYELTLKDFKEAYADHRNGKRLTKWAVRLFAVMLVVLATVTVFGFILRPLAEAARTAMPLVILIAFYIVVLWVLPSWSLRRQFERQPGAQGPRTATLDDMGVHWRWSGGVSDIEWRNYIRVIEGKNQILFYTSPAAFNMLPKRALTSEQLAEVRQLLAKHVDSTK